MPVCAFGQIRATVKDSVTLLPVPYVNIWVEGENTGTTANEQGYFSLQASPNSGNIIFSSIGYHTKRVSVQALKGEVLLNPVIVPLDEVIVKPPKNKKLTIAKFRKAGINYYFACNKEPWITARFFKYDPSYSATPYLKGISLLTNGHVAHSTFNIRIYAVDKTGKPGEYLCAQNILAVARKGKHLTRVDLSDRHIRFPQNGLFIALEWFITDENRYDYSYTVLGSSEKLSGTSYEPHFGTIPADTDENSWIYRKGGWERIWKNNGTVEKYKDKYNLLAIELDLSN